MKHLRFQLLAALLCLLCGNGYAANVLRVDSVRYPAGKTVSLPIVLENSSDITGVQFDISVPYELETDAAGNVIVQLSKTRAASHVYTTKSLGTESRNADTHGGVSTYYKYRIIVYSDQNALLLDNVGTLLTVNLTTSIELKNGAVLPIYLLDNSVTLSNREKENVLTNKMNGAITIEEIPRPDLMPTDVTFDGTSVAPGGKFKVSWIVKNIGQVATDDGWSEQISLVSVSGNLVKTIATTYYDQKLSAGSQVSRTAEIVLPTLLGLDGVCKVQVAVVPTEKTGEHISLRDNNTAQSSKNTSVSKLLTLELSQLRVVEGSNQRITAKLSRSGRWNNVRTFTVSGSPADGRLELPTTVSIPVNQSGTVFYINVGNNNKVDNDSIVTISIAGDNYEAATARVVIEDDEFPELTVKSSKSVVTEGETFNLTITTPRVSSEPIAVSITSENNKRFKFPSQATIPAGKSSVTVSVQTVDDELPNLEESNKFTVSAAKFNRGEAIVLLQDNDMPVLSLTLTPDKVGEGAGPTAVSAVLTRTGKVDNKITIKLSDNANGGLYYSNKTLEMAAGVETIYFNLGPVDNAIVDGDRNYTITAGIWVSSCNCASSGESAGNVSATLSVLDNDGAALAVSSQASTVKEGGQTKLTIKRNTTENSQPLTVSISANDETDLTFPKTVTIPAGQQSVDVDVVSKKNNVSGDSRTIIFTVSCSGYSSGTCFLLITDQTLPDARIAELSCKETESLVNSTVTLHIKVVNEGVTTLPIGTKVKIYKKGTTMALATLSTLSEIPANGSELLERVINLPNTVGENIYYAVINEDKVVNELVFTNNTSNELSLTTTSPFSAIVKTDKTIYQQGNLVSITGKLQGEQTANAAIDVYMVNDGVREVKSTRTNGLGEFSLDWQLYSLQSGHFIVGACYPEDQTTEAMAQFDVYGLKRANSGYITCDVTVGEPYQGTIKLMNPGTLGLKGLKAQVIQAPDGCTASFSLPQTIAAGATVDLSYTLNATSATPGNDWQPLVVRITSTEGASLDITLYYYGRTALGNLMVESHKMNTTMVKGQTRDYSFIVTNTGKGNTGKITLSLPKWMQPLTGATMTGLKQNDSTTVVLRFVPTSQMQLNVPVTGRIGINCENGNGTYIDYMVTPVSEAKGNLVIDVTDEYTYYTEEAPHLAGAKVEVRNPYTNTLVSEGLTNTDGLFTVNNLAEGYYKVTVSADKHDTYQNNILVDPGVTTTKVVTLHYQAISVSWDVVETEIEDEYDIVTTVTYETNVPAPVIEIITPDKIDAESLGEGESLVFYAIITNKGLITGQNTEFYIPEEAGGYSWEPLVDINGIDLAPQQSYTIPIKVTRLALPDSHMRRANNSSDGCSTYTRVETEYVCGPDGKPRVKSQKNVQYKSCPANTGGGNGGYGVWGGLGGPNGQGTITYLHNDNYHATSSDSDCNDCRDNVGKWAFDCAMSFVPGGGGCAYGMASGATTIASGEASAMDYVTTTLTSIGCGLELGGAVAAATGVGIGAAALMEVVGMGINVLNCFLTFVQACGPTIVGAMGGGGSGGGFGGAVGVASSPAPAHAIAPRAAATVPNQPSYVTRFSQVSQIEIKMQVGYMGYISEVLGDTLWLYNASFTEMYNVLEAVSKQNGKISMSSIKAYQPEGISDALFQKFIERYNNTLDFDATGKVSDNMIHASELLKYIDFINAADAEAVALGYKNANDMWETEVAVFEEAQKKGHNSVCSTISLQISQTMTMTRQAFRGTLTVYNGNQDGSMTDVKLHLTVTNNTTGESATSREFEIHTESLNGFNGELDMESGWTLGNDASGTATILFIPSKYAAPDKPIDYSFGGTLSYIDPSSGLEVHRDLYPVTLTVKPSPELDLTYFMQRDLYGDDALTEEVEPIVPGEFAVILNNKGNGDATNVRMVTRQPEIIDNEKGLLINFEFVSSQLNGQEKTLALGETIPTEFGTIPAHSQAYAQWWLQSSLLGHFIDYKIEATHVTSYGNENLSLLDQVTIHELIHGFTPPMLPGGSPGRAFLVNDVEDANDLPDQIYFTDATQKDAFIATSAVATKQSDTEYLLTVTPSQAGWNYGVVIDPTVGKQKLIRVVRQRDGMELPLDNVWQTDRLLIDAAEWEYINRLHFIGLMTANDETYVLTFEAKPDVELKVESYTGIPAEGTVQTKQLKEITVTFNKAIKAESFTTADITLACQGSPLDVSKIVITKVDDQTFKLNLAQLTSQNGYYVLTVQTSGITDVEGFSGALGKQGTWVQFLDGKVNLAIAVQPEGSGTVTPSSGNYEFGKVITLTATPKEGYEFLYWTQGTNGISLSETPSFKYTPSDDQILTAVFQAKKVNVTVNYREDAGTIEGGGTGIYAYGTELTLKATPADGYQFDGWMIDSVKVTGSPDANTLTLSVTKPVRVDAMFSVRPGIILSGRVTSSVDGTPIGNATITLTHDNIVYTTTTDRFGRYSIQVDDRSLTYAIHCEAPGYIWSANSDIWFDEIAKTKDFVLLQGETVMVPIDGIFAFSPNVDVEVDDLDVTVWYVTEFDKSSFILKQVASGKIKAGEGVIIVGTPQDRLDMSKTSDAHKIFNNLLVGTGQTPYEVKDDNVFILKESANSRKFRVAGDTDAHFYRAAKGTVIPEGKAYIHYTLEGMPDEVGIIWDDTSLINMVKQAMEDDENHYGLDGRPIYKMDKGIHILKGRKVIVK